MQTKPPLFLDGPNGRIAYRKREGENPTIVWLGGYRSDMLGSKATFIDNYAQRAGRAFLRFDYSGHGESGGEFETGCIGDWISDAVCAIEQRTSGPLTLIGSSMGAWIANHVALRLPQRLQSMVLIAPATDFTEKLMEPALTPEQRKALAETGRLEIPSDDYPEPEIFTRKLFEDGARQSLMTGKLDITCPIRILQGMQDASVPWTHALDHMDLYANKDVELYLVKSGDHRLSAPAELALLEQTLKSLGNAA